MAAMLGRAIRGLLVLCFLAVFAAGLAGCGGVAAVAGAEKPAANYPDVWERVLPEEVRTNIANYYWGNLGPVVVEKTDLEDYMASVMWLLDEAYHVAGDVRGARDDVVLRFVGRNISNSSEAPVFYYSFFSGRLLTKDGRYEFSRASGIRDIVAADRVVRKLLFSAPAKITLSNGVVYDESHTSPEYTGLRCDDPAVRGDSMGVGGTKALFTSHKEGAHFLPADYADEDTVREKSWLLVQSLEEPRLVSKKCTWGAGMHPTDVYNYYQYSFLRTGDDVVALPDGTFLFVGTGASFPVFHIVRLRSDMSIPPELSRRYKWVSYKDYVGILDLHDNDRLFSGRNKICPFFEVSHPHCIEAGEDGRCSRIKGSYVGYDRYIGERASSLNATSGLVWADIFYTAACLSPGLRDYVRGDFEIYHCREGEGDETVAGFAPCGEEKGE